jgi:hypothetical protein
MRLGRKTGLNTESSSTGGRITVTNDLPKGLAAPARRALMGAGYVRLEQLAEADEADIMRLHGMGPNAMAVLRQALAERGLTFRGG